MYCPAPWNSLSILPDGRVRICCHASDSHLLLNKSGKPIYIHEINSLKEFHNNPFLKKVKDKFSHHLPVEACKGCVQTEKTGGYSARNEFLDWFPNCSAKDGPLEFLDISFSNLCNLQCPMCSVNYSSRWSKDNEVKEAITTEFLERDLFKEIAKNLKFVLIQGGEPLMSPMHKKFLQALEKEADCKSITLLYMTNLTIFPGQEEWSLWKKFKEVRLNISLEGVEETYNQTRPPFKFEKFKANLEKLVLEKRENIIVEFKSIIQLLNYENIESLLNFLLHFKSNKLIRVPVFELIRFPSYFSPSYLPRNKREKISKSLLKLIKDTDQDFSEEEHRRLKDLERIVINLDQVEQRNPDPSLVLRLKYLAQKYQIDYSQILKDIAEKD